MDKMISQMIIQAHNALQYAYAPYSHFKVACCIVTDKNHLYTGVNVENSSYSLTSCAESSAICQMIVAGEQHIKEVVILANNNVLCPPCGACRQRMYEFSTPTTRIHLCDDKTILQSWSMDQLLPVAFDFNP